MGLEDLEKKLKKYASEQRGKLLQRYFKTGKGEHGEGDVFLGLVVGDQRKIAKQFNNLPIKNIQELLNSKVHEKRLIALLILVEQFKKSDEPVREKIFDFYLKNTKNINNWDLVDLSAPNIVGKWLLNKPRDLLYKLATSDDLWEKRISIISTLTFIRNNEFEDTIKISEILLKDKHDLIHKAVGWMLREVGKKEQDVLENFLKKHYKKMPRTMLRYSIERFEENKRQKYLKGEI